MLGPGPPWFSSPQGLVRVSPGLGLELTPSPRKKVSQRTLRVKCGIFMPKAWTSWCEGPQCSVGVLCVAASRSLVSEPAGDAETQGPALADWEAGKEGLPPRNELVESWQRGCSAEVLDKGAGGAAALAPQTRPRL